VCEEIRLDALRDILVLAVRRLALSMPPQDNVRYERPPVVERIEPLVLETGERLDAQIKYYDYGVVSVVFELPFSGDWDTLVRLASRWVWDTDFASLAQKIAKPETGACPSGAGQALRRMVERRLFHLSTCATSPVNPSASQLLAAEGGRIAQIVRRRELRFVRRRTPGNSAIEDFVTIRMTSR